MRSDKTEKEMDRIFMSSRIIEEVSNMIIDRSLIVYKTKSQVVLLKKDKEKRKR